MRTSFILALALLAAWPAAAQYDTNPPVAITLPGTGWTDGAPGGRTNGIAGLGHDTNVPAAINIAAGTGFTTNAPVRLYRVTSTTNIIAATTNILVAVDGFTNYAPQFFWNPNWTYLDNDNNSYTGAYTNNSTSPPVYAGVDENGAFVGRQDLISGGAAYSEINFNYILTGDGWEQGRGTFIFFPGLTNITHTTNYIQ